jgi:hypothetical protein
VFARFCRTFSSGGTRIRTGDTMIFSHMQKPLGMRKTRIGKRIRVYRVPLDTSWFCPYCCATVDTAYVTLSGAGTRRRSPRCPDRAHVCTRENGAYRATRPRSPI